MTSAAIRPMPGGPLAVDLLNTRWRASGQTVDWLDEASAVKEFGESYGRTVDRRDVDATRSSLVEARDLIDRLLGTAPGPDAISHDLIDEMNATLRLARTSVEIGEQGPALAIGSDDASNRLAIAALVNTIELLSDQPSRIRSCEHEDCILWFLDTSKAGRRRWCSMERCGNRAKARRHYERTTKAGEPST